VKLKLTEKTVAKLKAPTKSGKQEVAWDAATKGFGVLLSGKTSTKTYIVQRDLKNGKTRRVTVAPVNVMSLKDARRRAEEIIVDLIAGKDPKARGSAAMTVADTFKLYVAKKTELKPRTAELYLDVSHRYFARWATTPLSDITAEMVVEEHERIGKISKAGANNAMRALRAVHNYVAPGAPNPVQLRKRWFHLTPRQGRVKGDDLAAFYRAVDALPNPVQRDFLKLVLFTGLRRREATGLLWSDVDFSDGIIRLPSHRVKNGRLFDVPMTDLVRDLLVARRAIGDTKWVFPADSKSGHLEEPKAPLKLVKEASGIKIMTHDLRRTYLTVADRCVSGVAKKALVNHALSDKDVTEGYIGLEPKELAEAAQTVADRIRELCQIAPPSDTSTATRPRAGSAT
jgi:integrase